MYSNKLGYVTPVYFRFVFVAHVACTIYFDTENDVIFLIDVITSGGAKPRFVFVFSTTHMQLPQ